MSDDPAGPRPRLNVSGYRRGRYVVISEDDDGTLVIAPDPEPGGERTAASRRRQGLAGMVFRRQDDRSIEEIIGDWGVELRRDERIAEFQMVEVERQTGFAVVTNKRLILSAISGAAPRLYELEGATVELHNRRRDQELRIHWPQGGELILTSRHDAVPKLHRALQGS